MPDFIDRLVQLNTQNFLGGLATGAQAEKEALQNQTVNNLYKKFMTEKNELSTKDEVVAEMNQNPETAKEIGSVEETMTAKITKASSTLFKSLNNIGALENMYRPYITAFATLGEDGIQIANSLSKELSTKQSLEEKKGEIPYKAMQYANLEAELTMNFEKLAEYTELKAKNKRLEDVENFIIGSDIFNNMSPVPADAIIGTRKGDTLIAQYDGNYKALLAEVSGQFKDIAPNEISAAIVNTLGRHNKTLRARQSESLEVNKEKMAFESYQGGLAKTQGEKKLVDMAKRNAQDFTTWYNGLTPNAVSAIRYFLKSGVNPSEALKVFNVTGEYPQGFDPKKMIGVTDEFLKDAKSRVEQFNMANSVLALEYTDGNWFNHKMGTDSFTDKSGKKQEYNVKQVLVPDTGDIIRVRTGELLFDTMGSGASYNPIWNVHTKNKLMDRVGELNKGSNFRVKQDTFTQETQDVLEDIPLIKQGVNALEVFYRSIQRTYEKETKAIKATYGNDSKKIVDKQRSKIVNDKK